MRTIGVIPARFGSTRFPGKPLFKIKGRPLIEWVIRRVKECTSLDEIIVATDHAEIFSVAETLGVRAVMTDSDLPSGSDRIWAAVKEIPCDLIINVQGDEPLIDPKSVDDLVKSMKASGCEMGTLVADLNLDELKNQNVVKAVVNVNGEAIYFSRFPIPYSRKEAVLPVEGCFKHLGLYAYEKSFLGKFCAQAPVAIEVNESLEQLRALYLGARIKVLKVDHYSIGVDTPDDVARVEHLLK